MGRAESKFCTFPRKKSPRQQTRRSETIWGKMLRMRRTQFSDCVHICAKWRRHRLSTTETRRDLVKLYQQARACRLFQASVRDPVCPRILDRIRLRDSSVGWVPQLLFVSRRRADPSWTLSGRHNNRATHPNRRSSSGRTRSIHAGLLVRVRVLYPARGPPVPHVGVAAHTRNSGLACGIAG